MSESIDIKKELVRNIAKIPEEKLLDLVAEYGTPGITDELKNRMIREKCFDWAKDTIWECLAEEHGYLPTSGDIEEYTEFGGHSCSIEDDYPNFSERIRFYADLEQEDDWVGRTVKEYAGELIKFLNKKGFKY